MKRMIALLMAALALPVAAGTPVPSGKWSFVFSDKRGQADRPVRVYTTGRGSATRPARCCS